MGNPHTGTTADFGPRLLQALLRPVVRYCIRHAITVQQILEAVKKVAIDLAADEMRANDERVTVSRLSVITGLQRRDISKMLSDESRDEPLGSLASRVLGHWENSTRFQGRDKLPKPLSLEQFRELVSTVSTDVNSAAVLFCLERAGSVERNPSGLLTLRKKHYVPKSDPVAAFDILARDCEDLIESVEENVFRPEGAKNLHGRTEFDNISRSHLKEIRSWLLKEGSEFHQRARQYLSRFDLDINPDAGKDGGAKVTLGTFSRIKTRGDQ